MLPRTLETEVMDTLDEAVDYDAMDHAAVNRCFVDDFLAFLEPARTAKPQAAGGAWRILDVGTGTAQIPIELCGRGISARVVAVDLAAHMLQIAQRNVIRAGLRDAIKLEHIDAKSLPCNDGTFDAIISNSIVHHIPQPLGVLREMVRVLRPGGSLFVRDLLRPPDEQTVAHLVATYAADANAHQRQMFDDSLHAALTLDEVRQLLAEVGLPLSAVTQTSDRHWTIRAKKPISRGVKT